MAVNLDSISQYILNIIILILGIIAIGAFLGASVWMALKTKRFNQFKCVIWERDGFGQLKETKDKGGIFVDSRTKNKRLFLKKNKVGLNPDTIPYLQSGKIKTIYLLKTGLKNFHYISVNVKEPDVTLTVGEEDVNWSINAYERQKKLFTQSLLMQLLPFMIIAFVTIIILIMFIYFFKNFTVLAEMAESLKMAADVIAGARSGTVIIPS